MFHGGGLAWELAPGAEHAAELAASATVDDSSAPAAGSSGTPEGRGGRALESTAVYRAAYDTTLLFVLFLIRQPITIRWW